MLTILDIRLPPQGLDLRPRPVGGDDEEERPLLPDGGLDPRREGSVRVAARDVRGRGGDPRRRDGWRGPRPDECGGLEGPRVVEPLVTCALETKSTVGGEAEEDLFCWRL